VKISRTDRKCLYQVAKVRQFAGHDVDYISLPFQNAFYVQQPCGEQGLALLAGGGQPDHHVDVAGFVFQGNKSHTRGCAGALTAGYQAGYLHRAAGFYGVEFAGAQAETQMALFPQQSQGMAL